MKKILIPAILASSLFFTGCASTEIGESKDVSQEKIYQDFHYNFEEGDKNATFYCQFRFAGDKGTTLILSKPAQVTFDEQLLKLDSSEFSGAFYAFSKSNDNLLGKHRIVYTDINNKKIENEFTLTPINMVDVPETASKNADLKISLDATLIQPDDYVEVHTVEADSSFSFSLDRTINTNSITIPAAELKKQHSGKIMLVAKVRREIPLKNTTSEGGRIIFGYTSKHATIQLKD